MKGLSCTKVERPSLIFSPLLAALTACDRGGSERGMEPEKRDTFVGRHHLSMCSTSDISPAINLQLTRVWSLFKVVLRPWPSELIIISKRKLITKKYQIIIPPSSNKNHAHKKTQHCSDKLTETELQGAVNKAHLITNHWIHSFMFYVHLMTMIGFIVSCTSDHNHWIHSFMYIWSQSLDP